MRRLQQLEDENKQLRGEVKCLKGQVHGLQQRVQADEKKKREAHQKKRARDAPQVLTKAAAKISSIHEGYRRHSGTAAPAKVLKAKIIAWHAQMSWQRTQDKLQFLRNRSYDCIKGRSMETWRSQKESAHGRDPLLKCELKEEGRSVSLLESTAIGQFCLEGNGACQELTARRQDVILEEFFWEGTSRKIEVGNIRMVVRPHHESEGEVNPELMLINECRPYQDCLDQHYGCEWGFHCEVARQYYDAKSKYSCWLRWQMRTVHKLMKVKPKCAERVIEMEIDCIECDV